MATAAQLALIAAFRKEAEDMITALVKRAFKVQYGELVCVAGENSVSFTETDWQYNDTDYEIFIYEALDANGVDIKFSITAYKTVGGITLICPRPCTARWQTTLRVPDWEFIT